MANQPSGQYIGLGVALGSAVGVAVGTGIIFTKFARTRANVMFSEKIVINVNMGRHLDGTKVPMNVKGSVLETLEKITGQKPVMIAAKKSVSNFKVRAGYETAAFLGGFPPQVGYLNAVVR